MYIVIAIIAFGVLIAIHEFGHFIVAKLCHVKVNEYSIGMGPAILKKQGKETLYAWRLLPIGGYCAMEGEDEDTGDERAFTRQSAWKRVLILVAGAGMNFLLGFLIVAALFHNQNVIASNKVSGFVDGFLYAENGLEVGDVIVSIDGHSVNYLSEDLSFYLSRSGETADFVILRDGQEVSLNDYGLKIARYNGQEQYGIYFEPIRLNAWEKIKHISYISYDFVRMVWAGLSDLITGAVGLREMSGVVGIVDVINDKGQEVEQETQSVWAAIEYVMYLVAFIAVNLAVMNLLPIPALDGGRIFFIFINLIAEKVFRKTIPSKYEGYVHAAGMVLLLGLMAVILVSDILKIVR